MEIGPRMSRQQAGQQRRLVAQQAVFQHRLGIEGDAELGIAGDELRLPADHFPQGPADLVGVGGRVDGAAPRRGELLQLRIGFLLLAQIDDVQGRAVGGRFGQLLLRCARPSRRPIRPCCRSTGPRGPPGGRRPLPAGPRRRPGPAPRAGCSLPCAVSERTAAANWSASPGPTSSINTRASWPKATSESRSPASSCPPRSVNARRTMSMRPPQRMLAEVSTAKTRWSGPDAAGERGRPARPLAAGKGPRRRRATARRPAKAPGPASAGGGKP